MPEQFFISKLYNMNSKIILLLSAALLITLSSFAGNTFIFKKLKLKKVGIQMGVEQDLILGDKMSHKYFNSLVNDPNLNSALENRIDANFSKYSGVCENPHIQINLAYQLPKPNHELHFNVLGVFNRVDGIYYNRLSSNTANYDYLNYDLYSSELGLEVNYVLKKELQLIKNVLGLNLYASGGANTGFQFENYLTISGTETIRDRQLGVRLAQTDDVASDYTFETNERFNNSYRASNGINQRVFAGAGVGFVLFNRLELGINGKYGYGYRYHFSNDFAATNIRSYNLSAKWVLK